MEKQKNVKIYQKEEVNVLYIIFSHHLYNK